MIFHRITGKFQLKIKDRESAGNILGNTLNGIVKKEDRNSTLILGIPRGGLVIAEVIARKLKCEFDLLMVKRLRAPHNDELAIGAVTEDGTTYLNELIINKLEISQHYIENEKSYQLTEIERLTKLYKQGNKISKSKNTKDSLDDLKNKTIIVVDDGSATGSTLIAAVRVVRKNMMPKRLIIALPISPKGTINKLKNEDINNIEVITSPENKNFVSVEQYYRNFNQITDRQVFDIMNRKLS